MIAEMSPFLWVETIPRSRPLFKMMSEDVLPEVLHFTQWLNSHRNPHAAPRRIVARSLAPEDRDEVVQSRPVLMDNCRHVAAD
jgi:hypothetical protein